MDRSQYRKESNSNDSLVVLNAVLEVLPGVAWITDGETKIVAINSRAQALQSQGINLLDDSALMSSVSKPSNANTQHVVIPLNHGTKLSLHQIKSNMLAVQRLKDATKKLDEYLQTSL